MSSQPAAARVSAAVPAHTSAVPARPAGPHRVPALAPVPATVRRLPVAGVPAGSAVRPEVRDRRGPVAGHAGWPAGHAERVDPRPFARPEPGRALAAVDHPGSRWQAGLVVDRAAWAAWLDGELLDLTYLEFQVLDFLVRHPGRVYSRAALLRHVWGHQVDEDPGQAGRTVDVLVTRLRRKLGAENRSRIETVRRVGYRYRPAPNDPAL
jgi:hypothetical protein